VPKEPILEIAGITKHFGGITAVDGVDLEVQPGEAVGIIGPNGSGKSTLVNLITGFIRADDGRVIFKGKNITRTPPHKIASNGIARSFQMARPFGTLPAYKNLIVPLSSPRVARRRSGRYGDRDEMAVHLLEDVGFERESQIPYKSAAELPHGYLKRLELGRCLAMDPEVMILDELFSGMSMSEVAGALPILEQLRDDGITLIMVEHRLRELFRVVDKVIVLDFGRKIAEGSPEEVMKEPEVKEAYLGAEAEEHA